MTQLHEGYTREIHDELGYLAAWPPGAQIALGDVGVVGGRRFRRLTSLSELGIGFTTSAKAAIGDIEYATKGLVEVSSRTEGELLTTSATLVSITFAASGATFFQAGDCGTELIVNLPTLGRALARAPEWQRRYVVITEVVHSGPIAVLVSSEHGAKAELQADSTIGSSLLASVKAGLGFVAQKGFAAHLTKENGATPLFQAMRLRRRMSRGELTYRNEEVNSHRDQPEEAETDLLLRQLTWNDFAAAPDKCAGDDHRSI